MQNPLADARTPGSNHTVLLCSVVDRHRFDADPDPNSRVDTDPDPDWHQNNADPHADPIPCYKDVKK